MAWTYFMNMEKLALNVASEHIKNMSDNNFEFGCEDNLFLDEDSIINNLQNGFVTLTQLSCFYEAFLNSILINCIAYDKKLLLKCSTKEKIEIIFMHYKKDISAIKNDNNWNNCSKCASIRNNLTHYKNSRINECSGLTDFSMCGKDISTFFTKENMNKMYESHTDLAKLIADSLDLKINSDVNIFQNDARGIPTSYVYDPMQHYND